ncbi:MAG: hypothetical protein R3325_15715 [Thermoanaerobaculia bacterium]|nr:hypothetical protein [Thermoanaerobaculia bacterium]
MVLLGLLGLPFLYQRTTEVGLTDLPKKPRELVEVARRHADAARGEGAVRDEAWGWTRSADLPDSFALARSPATPRILFWYRESPDYLLPTGWPPWVTLDNPDPGTSDVVTVITTPAGSVLELRAVSTPSPSDHGGSGAERSGSFRVAELLVFLAGNLALLVGLVYGPYASLRGRGDPRAAFWLSSVFLSTYLIWWLLKADDVFALPHPDRLVGLLVVAVPLSLFVFVGHRGFEALVEDRCPFLRLESWKQLLNGRFQMEAVGQDTLVGAVAGVAVTYLLGLAYLAATELLSAEMEPQEVSLGALLGARQVAAHYFLLLWSSIVSAFQFLSFLVLLLLVFRLRWLAVAIFLLASTAMASDLGGLLDAAGRETVVEVGTAAVTAGVVAFVLLRWGLLALFSMHVFHNISSYFALTFDPGSWYFASTIVVIATFVCAGLVAFEVWSGAAAPAAVTRSITGVLSWPFPLYNWLLRLVAKVEESLWYRVLRILAAILGGVSGLGYLLFQGRT